ncbi:hypothetical protein [Empedobacter falsenii]|uniref:Uncharacterized protein n=1 Tax=Empedobacter falsenii TaxID=343874 RepID=A0ABY8V9M7_9FLAO|nr:hypothetical protein [Empedobacter falsenii]WIH98208.1 hypothetical protein OBA43_04560 [Empedobacter falsenii]
MSKFRENSKSAALNLESINTFKDKSLRTARIDQKYRVVLKEVIASEEYLLLWIDNHDEAMDWAKNKMINWNENTQAYQVFKLDDAVVEPDPIIQHEQLFMAQYGKVQLLEIGVPEVLIPSVLGVNKFEDLEKLEDYLPLDVFENLFYLLDGANYDVLLTEIREGLSSSDKENSKNNSRSFIELTDDEILNEAITGCLNKWKYYLHPSQAKIVNSNFNGPVKVSGAGGT